MTKQQHNTQSSKGGFFKIKIHADFHLYCMNEWKMLSSKIHNIRSHNLLMGTIL